MNSKTVLIVGCFVLLLSDQVIGTDENLPKLYEEIGCTKINNSNPTSFECPDLTTYSTDKCYLKGKTFNVNDDIDESVVPNCRAACKCVQNGNETAYINCANVECPEDLGGRDWSCVSQYDNLTQCCRSREVCDKAKIGAIHKCEFGGKSYHIGERIYPDDLCYECLCAEDFNSKTPIADNPHCAKIDCGIELKLKQLQEGCIPVYYKTPTCCPIEYKCPSKDDAIESSAADEKSTCKFGDLTLKHGEKIKTEDKCLKCECKTPPYITCIKTDSC
ncbi:uncharacterized protein LOC116345227 [Contarinia nasturtii]|uniref:uncharacterized protein LOC116345227 n=1 Tax=Contarinia nasturtii TaxID=265458 RepID=UPI0012D4ABFE|nr:uncharacterized protein LOC116345227 [Contarinia nasturtii]